MVTERSDGKVIGRIRRVPLREVWKHEAYDFTAWLEENVDVLNDLLEVPLETAERESPAGDFRVDLVGEDRDGNTVVIENQLDKSDHQHLGELITYLAAMEAKVAVWIVSEPRPEHTRAISWLNEATDASFYLVKLEAVQIGDSPPAPLLTLIVGPSPESRVVGERKRDIAERHEICFRFWKTLLDRARGRTNLHAESSPSERLSLATETGKSGLLLKYQLGKHGEAWVDLYIDRGSKEENEAIFDQLFAHKQAVEEAFGEALEWERLERYRACRVRKRITLGGWRDEERWPEIQDAMIDAMVRLEAAFRPYIDSLQI